MRAIRLVAMADEYDNKPGLVMKGCLSFEGLMADRDGGLTAHDVLEHQNGIAEMGPVWDELEASGGIWQVRGRWGDMATKSPNIHSPQTNVAADVSRMFQQWHGEDCQYLGPRGLRAGSRPHDYDDDFRDIINIARPDIRDEWESMNPDWPFPAADVEEYLTLALHRMRVGFRKAERRFGTHFDGHSLFVAIRDAVAHAIKYELEWEGQEFILRYGNGEATCRAVWEREEY